MAGPHDETMPAAATPAWVPRRHIDITDRPTLGAMLGQSIMGPVPEESAIVDELLREVRIYRAIVWVPTKCDVPGLRAWKHMTNGLRVIVSGGWCYDDDRFWMHVSLSRPSSLPTWDDVRLVKDAFLGVHRRAIQLLPRADEYVNIHPHTLNLWCCLSEDVVPNFGVGGTI